MADKNNDKASSDVNDPVLYDEENDVLYVTLSDRRIDRTVLLDDMRLVDYDATGAAVGAEFMAASEGLDLSDVPLSGRIQILLNEANIDFPIVA